MKTTAVVIGAGHAGLAMSRRLTERSIDHIVLERGEVANSWRNQRWPSLRLLTPNWQIRLPGHDYHGDDPDGYMPVAEVVATLSRYGRLIGAPVRTATTVHAVRAAPQGFEIQASDDILYARAVVLATGACTLPAIPGLAGVVPHSIATLTPLTYRDPGQLPDGGVLVVGASATDAQLADQIHRSGRPVTLAVGEHVRLPRTYRGRDIFWWLEARRNRRLRSPGQPPPLLPAQGALPLTMVRHAGKQQADAATSWWARARRRPPARSSAAGGRVAQNPASR